MTLNAISSNFFNNLRNLTNAPSRPNPDHYYSSGQINSNQQPVTEPEKPTVAETPTVSNSSTSEQNTTTQTTDPKYDSVFNIYYKAYSRVMPEEVARQRAKIATDGLINQFVNNDNNSEPGHKQSMPNHYYA